MPRRKNDPKLPNGPGLKLLRAVGRYNLLTAAQGHRLLFREKYVYQELRRLVLQGYLEMVEPKVKVPAYWRLTDRGRNYLINQDISVATRIHHAAPKSLNLEHRLAVVDVLITIDLLAREDSRFVVLEMRNETELSRHPIKVALADGSTWHYAPDGWIHFAVDGREASLLIELDRGTEHQKVWRNKVDAIVSLLRRDGGSSLYNEHFAALPVAVAVAVVDSDVPAPLRARVIHQWTGLELEKLGKGKAWEALFRIRPANPATEDPKAFFTSESWATPGTTKLTPLIGGLW